MEVITPQEKKLIGLGENDPLPEGGREYELYSFSGFGVDSTSSWRPRGDRHKLGYSFFTAFGQDFCPGSLNVRLVEGIPWLAPEDFTPRKVQIGVFNVSYALPVILNESCVGVVALVNVRGFDPATGKPEHIDPLKIPEMYGIFSVVNIRERLKLPAGSDQVIIKARLLDGNHLAIR